MVQHLYHLWCKTPPVKDKLTGFVLCLLLAGISLASDNGLCKPDKIEVLCSASGDRWIKRREQFTFVNGTGCKVRQTLSEELIVCPQTLASGNNEPCRRGRQLVEMIRFVPKKCVCVPVKYSQEISCPCRSSQLSNEDCSSNNGVRVITYERRAGDECERRHVRMNNETCTQGYLRLADEEYRNSSISGHLMRARRSTGTAVEVCGKNQIFVVNRNPCPDTCERVLFGKPNVCHRAQAGPGCECRQGYVLDGILCVPPSQCGCLNSICVDRAPAEKCRQWRAEGRCERDQVAMSKVCRATCHNCQQPCEDMISTVQCEQLKQEGKCQDDFYRTVCRLTCSPQECRCPPCRIDKGECNPETRNVEIKQICFRLQRDGQCKPLVTKQFEPCGECPMGLVREPGPCNYCQRQRQVVLRTFFREDGGLFRCTVVKHVKLEPCACQPVNYIKSTCVEDKLLVRKLLIRKQTSCFQCSLRKIQLPNRLIVCKKPELRSGNCYRKGPNQPLIRKVVTVHEVARQCKCQPLVQVREEICNCPPKTREGPTCFAHRNQLAFKTTTYVVQGKQCVPRIGHEWIPRPACPPSDKADEHQGKFECNPETCERTWHKTTWHWEECKCKPITLTEPSGKCCCPKSRRVLSPCQKGMQKEQLITYELVEGQCIRHVQNRLIHCTCPPPQHSYKCRTDTNERMIKTVLYKRLPDRNCGRIESVAVLPTTCKEEGIRRITECVRKPGESKPTRNLLITTPKVDNCICKEPEAKVVDEACGCPEAQEPPVKLIHKCPEICHQRNGDQCGRECNDVFIWRRFVYDEDSNGNAPRCKTEVIRKIVKPCCCPRNRKITRSCDPTGQYEIFKVTENRLRHDKCVPILRIIRRPVHCSSGFQQRVWGPVEADGTRKMKLLFNHVKQCRCATQAVQRACSQQCPKPIQSTTCDPGSRELVHTIENFIPIGCRCDKRVFKRRTSVLCPEYSEPISTHCSPETNIETIKYRRHFQHNCECREEEITKHRPCGCSKPMLSEPTCDAKNNQIHRIQTVFDVVENRCIPRKLVVHKPVDCRPFELEEAKRNHGVPRVELHCDAKSGRAQLMADVWQPVNCRCVKRPQVIREGVCQCPAPQKVMHCDGTRNLWIRKTITFHLDKKTLKCRRHIREDAQPTYCQSARIRWGPCNPQTGHRKLHLIYHRRDHCHCIREMRVMEKPCVCESKQVKKQSQCDSLRGILHTVFLTQHWSDKLHQCVPARVIKSTTIKCLPLARIFRAPCSEGKMLEKIVESYRDVNECQCRKRIRTEVRDCRCPTKMLMDGKCDGHRTHWDELMVEQQWSEEKRACVVERIRRARHHCRCDEPKVSKECAKGVMHETKTISNLNVRTGSCDRMVLQRQYKPACESLMGMESQAQHDQLFVRNKQTQCDPNTCTRQLETYTRRYDPGRCSCDWSLVKTRRCTCCGCPKPKVQVSCQNNRELVGQVIYYTTHQQRCGHQCIEKTHAIHSEVDCHDYPAPPNGHWNDCDRRTCVQHFIAYSYEVQMCWCALTKKVLATRACCCPPNVRKEQRCTNGLPELVVYHTVLRDGRCVEVAKPEPLPLVCPTKKEVRHGECRPDSCRQPIFEIGWRLDPETCKCKTYQVLEGERECCCLEKSNVRSVCVGSCRVVVQEVFNYDKQNERCIKENHIQRVCPECPKPHVIREECDRDNTCLQTVKHVDFVLENCHCKRLERVEKVSCCCPKSTVLGTRCLEESGQVETKTLFYELVNGQCARRVKLDRMPVPCPPPEAEKLTLSCNPQTCLEPVLEQRWIRVGCRCVEQKPQQYRTCCCSNRIVRTKRICNPDGSSLLMTQSWRLHNGHCVPQVITKRLDRPICHPQRVTALGTCDTVTRRQVALVERFAVKQCRCQAIFREKIERICACPAPVEHAEPCQPATCLQRIVRIPWALNEQKGQCVRLPLQVQMRPCCCLREKEPPAEGTRCNPLTGEVELTRRSFMFNLLKRVCEVKEDKRYNKLDCPSHGRILRGHCNPLNGIAIDQVEMWEARLSECQCRRLVKNIKRICSCSHLDHVTPPMCLADEGVLIKKHVVHHLRQGGCQPEEKILKETIVCPEGEHPRFQCNPTTCDSVRTVSWVERVGCQCVPRVREERGKCCCPEPTEQQECTNGGRLLVLHKLSFILDKTRQICVPQKDKVQKEIECQETGPQLLKEYCDKETCHPVALLRQVVLRNCQCGNLVLRKVNKNTLCCCPPPRFKTNCYPQYGVISRVMYRYELFKGHCISRKFVDQDKIVCQKERITRGVCNRATGMRPLLRHYYELVGCKCHLRIRKDSEPCSCPLPQTAKLPCDPAKPIRKVVRVSFDLEEDTINRKMRCAKRIQLIRSEPCACEPTKIEKQCERGELVVIRKEHHLTVNGDEPTCVQRTYAERVPVICTRELTKIYRSQCEGFQRKVIHVREFVEASTCECRIQARVTFEACNCHLKNRVHQDCKNGVLLVSKELYISKPFVNHCIITTSRGVHPVVCEGRHEVVQTSGCTIQKDNGLFQSEEVRWQQVDNCQCITRRKQTLRLCGCPEPQLTKRCLDTVNMAVYKTTFIRIADECVPSQEVVTSEVRCADPAKIVERSTCETAGVDPSTNSLPGCFETFQVAVRQVEDCKCVEKLVTVRRRCCTPEPVVTRQCDMTRGAWVTTLKKFTLVPGKNLFELGSVVIRDHVLNVVREQQDQRVVCPEPKVHETCDSQTGLWTRTVTRFEMVNCHCIPMRQVERGRCQCPPPRSTETECKNNFRLRISDSYELINGKCVQRHDSKRVRCGCPKPVRRVYCDGEGRWVKCYTQFLLNPAASTCRLVKHCVRWYQDCPKDTTRISATCSAESEFKHTLQRVRFVNNAKTCHCDPQVLDQWTEMCQCNHLNRKWIRCKLGLIEIKQLTHHLENGDCVPKMVKYVKLPVCPKPQVHIRACDRNPNSPLKGWILKAIDTYHVRNCQCVRKRRVMKKPCDCNLIHPPRHARRCEEPAILHIKALFWTPSEGKCIPGFAIYTKHIKCPPERKLRLGPCVEGTDGIGRQLVEQLEQSVAHCECVWKVLATQQRICKCPPPKHSKECVDGGKAILRTLIAYTLKDNMCAPIQRQIKEDPCERQELPPIPPDQTGRCNPLTCSTERIHYQRVTVNCNCITQRVAISEACCCPRPSKPILRCHSSRNVMLHQQTFYQFKPAMGDQRAHCLPVMHVKSIAINCGPKLQRILVKKCDGEFHRVMIIRTVVENCLCKQRPTKELRIRCGCPRVIRRLPGACINQWANDRWIGFQAVVVQRSNLLKVNRVKCKPVIFEQKQRRCACPEPTEATECEGGKQRVKYRTIYKLNEELNNCEKHVFRKEDNPVCPPTKVVQSQCGPESNYEQTEITRAYDLENCECTPRLTKTKWICDCSAKFPAQRLVHCLPLGTKRLVEIRRWIQTGRECKPLVEKRVEPVECPKQLHVIKGECDREIPNRRKLIWLQQRPVNCRCVWHRLIHPDPSVHRIKSSVACRCRPKITVRQCRPPVYGQLAQMRMITVNFQLRDGECRPESRVDLHPVNCKNGVQLINGECDPMTNTRIVKRIISHLAMNECRCVTREFERRCHCSCPAPKLYLHCQRQQGLLRHIKIVHFLAEDKCLCKAKRAIRTSKVVCPIKKRLIQKGPCQHIPGKSMDSTDKHRQVVWEVSHRDGCQCVTKRVVNYEPCFCTPQPTVEKRCLDDQLLETTHSERRLSEVDHKCIRIIVNKIAKPVDLGKPEVIVRCNPQTGIEDVTELSPYVLNCKRNVRVKKSRRKCKCKVQAQLIHRDQCDSTCQQRLLWRREVQGEDGSCRLQHRLERRACCCPQPQQLESRCNAAKGLLEVGFRTFTLHEGVCVPQDQFMNKAVVCEPNEQVTQHPQPNGFVRVERHFNELDGCNCVRKKEVTVNKWNCPEPTTKQRCTNPEPGLYTIETVSTRWHVPKDSPVCSRLDTVVDSSPVDCSAKQLVRADTCQLEPQRHATVRVDHLFTSVNDGCHCVRNPPILKVHVCQCMKPEDHVMCDRERGLLMHVHTKYELSGDGTHCIPHKTKRIWKPSCSPTAPRHVRTTPCDPSTGLMYQIFEEVGQKDCRCVNLEKRVPIRCHCAKPIQESRCLSPQIREIRTTTFHLTPEGTCGKTVLTHKEEVRCQLLPQLLQSSPMYRVQRSQDRPNLIQHVHACHSAGHCLYKVREFLIVPDQTCACRWKVRELVQACCCPTDPRPQPLSSQCDARKGLIVFQKVDWNKHNGVCRPNIHQRVKQIVCEHEETVKPLEPCQDGRQKNLIRRWIRVGCKCVLHQQVVVKPCVCHTVSTAEVVFMIDGAAASRQTQYQERVQQLLFKTIEQFLLSHETKSQSNSFRFAVMTYADRPEIVLNLQNDQDPNRILEQVQELILRGERANLALALHTMLREVLPLKRPDVPVLLYIVTDGRDQNEDTVRIIGQVHRAQIQVTVAAMGAEPHGMNYLSALVTPPKAVHLLWISNTDSVNQYLTRISETLCSRACPASYVKASDCSRETGCIGRSYIHKYQFDGYKGQCVGETRVQTRRCCCMQQAPPPVRVCEQNRLIQIITNWQLTKDGTCSKFVIKRDATPLLLQQCSPPVDVRVGQCNAEGYAVELTVRRFLDNCECKENKSRRIVRCRCGPAHETKRCLADEIQIREITSQQLINGECHPRKLVKKTKLKCPPPLVYKSDCDSMTCQRRVTIVEHAPEQCICKRLARVTHETCCCKGQKAIRYEGCRYNALKTFVEESIEPKLTDGACVKRTRHRFEPVACPRNPNTVRHQCRHVSTMESGLRQKIVADPALIFRQVEQFWWQMDSCECRQMRRAHFEACGCDQSAVPAESQFVHRCNQQNGVLITYKHTLKLEVDGTRQSSDQTLMIPDLSHAKCRPEHTIVSARKIVCPEPKIFHTACETADDGREYRAVQLHRWNRQGCACQNLPPELVERQLCSCRPERVSKQCVTSRPGGPANRMMVKHIREEIVVTQDPSGKRVRLCKLAPIEEKVHLISCPRSQIKYSGCVNGLVHITLRLHLVTECQCQMRIRRLVTKCSRLPGAVNPALVHGPSNNDVAVTSQATQLPIKGHAQLVLPVYQIADCIDLLPVKQCTALEHPPHQVCEKPGQIRDLLCRRTCKQCTTCPLDQTKFSVVFGQLTDACIVSDKRYERTFFIRALVNRGDLAACKLACAKTPECSSIDYYVPRNDEADQPKCILNRVDPPTLMRRLDPRTVRIGSTEQDLERWNARKCLLFRKTCATECPKPQTIELSACGCHQFRPSYQMDPAEDQLKPVTLCAKQVRVRYFTQTSSGRCVAKEWTGMIPCVVGTTTVLDSPHVNCLDTKPPLWCQSVITQNPKVCTDISMKQMCTKSCGLCHCRGNHVIQGRCDRTGHTLEIKIVYREHPIHKLCITEVMKRRTVCEYCPVGNFSVVHECDEKSGTRHITHVRARLSHGRTPATNEQHCVFDVDHEKISCSNCLASQSDRQSITACIPVPHGSGQAKIKLITEYMVDLHGCCRVRRAERSFYCDGCPSIKVESSPCVNGKRLRHIIFYTRPTVIHAKHPSDCIRRVITRKENCIPTPHSHPSNCFDQLSTVDCHSLLSTGRCDENSEFARKLCAQTCGFCN